MRLVALLCCLVACATPAKPPTPVAPTPATEAPAEPEAPMSDAERAARAQWFPHELATVETEYGGDWDAFQTAKLAREAALDATWETARDAYPDGHYLRSAEDVRAMRVLFEEWEVARADEAAIEREARRVLTALAAGDFATVAEDCVMYGGDDRVALCLAELEQHRAAITAAVKAIDPATFSASFELTAPAPETGMTGQVNIPFGPPAPAPADAEPLELHPTTWQLELWWSGQVMPEANGPVHAHPVEPSRRPGRWRFYMVVEPYSRRPTYLI